MREITIHPLGAQPMWDITIHPFGLNQWEKSQSTPLGPNQCGTSQSTPFGVQRSYWHTTSCLPPLGNNKKEGRFPHPYKGSFVLFLNQRGTSQSTPFGPNVLTGTPSRVYPPLGNIFCSLPQPMWDITIHDVPSPTNVGHYNPPPLALTSLLAHHLVSTPLWGTAKRLAHRSMFGSDTICNNPNPPLGDIVLFGLSLSGFPSRL